MNKTLLRSFIFLTVVVAVQQYKSQSVAMVGTAEAEVQRNQKILYFNPEVFPDLPEIIEPTNTAFFSAVSDRYALTSSRMIRADNPMSFDSVDAATIKDFCKNNGADFAVVPKVKYFKVGLGQYVFSNQVEVSMKLYDAQGNYVTESTYNTYKRNMRMLGTAENSIKIGTNGAIKDIMRDLRKLQKANS